MTAVHAHAWWDTSTWAMCAGCVDEVRPTVSWAEVSL